MFIEYILVLLGAATPGVEVLVAVPIGILRGLSPFLVIAIGFIGNMLTVLLVIVAFQRLKKWMDNRNRKKGKKESKRTGRGIRIWNKYGMPGLALLGPILIGTHIAAFVGLLFGASKMNTTIWLTISIALWTMIFGSATIMGVDFFFN